MAGGWKARRQSTVAICSLLAFVFSSMILADLEHIRATREQHGHHEASIEETLLRAAKQRQVDNDKRSLATSEQNATLTEFERDAIKRDIEFALSRNVSRPPLEELVDKYGNITGDPEEIQKLLSFVIVGHGKCGTSTLMHWLADHPEIDCFRQEIWELMHARPDNLIRHLYRGLKAGDFKRCYKCPGEITQPHILEFFRTLWPKTKLFVGIRAIWWFQSLYNFRIQNLHTGETIPEPNKLIGRCTRGMRHTCTEKGNFAYNLLHLGKQNEHGPRPATELEEAIVGQYRRGYFNVSTATFKPNPIFLFDMKQLSDDNHTRTAQFRKDVGKFLELKYELPEMGHFIPGRQWHPEVQEQKDKIKIDICDKQYAPVREELMRLSRQNAQWIREVFLYSPSVSVSSRGYFESILDEWMMDPCGSEGSNSAQAPLGETFPKMEAVSS